MIIWSVAQELSSKSDPTLGRASYAIGQDTKMVLVEMKMMIIWSIAQELASKSDPTLGRAASAIGQVTKVVSSAVNVVDGPSLLMMIVVAMMILFFFTTTRLFFFSRKMKICSQVSISGELLVLEIRGKSDI